MDPKAGNPSNGLLWDFNLEKVQKGAAELMGPGLLVLGPLNAALEVVTNFLAWVLGSGPVRRHFHLVLSGLVIFGPVLSLWVSKYSIFANSHHFLYRKFLRSTWGWTCTLTGSFLLLLSFSARRSLPLSLRHLSRVGLAGLLWWFCRGLLTLLEDMSGACYEPVGPDQDSQDSAGPPLLLLHEDLTKASCVGADMTWRGYEVSQDVLALCLCCLLIVEETSVFGQHLAREEHLHRWPGAPLRLLFLFSVTLLFIWMLLLLCLLAYFPAWPSQQLGGALGYLGWRGLYQGWFRLPPSWGSPGPPGEELFTTTSSNKQLITSDK